MKRRIIFSYLTLIFILLVFSSINFSQDIDENNQPSKNWLKDYVGYQELYLYHRFDNYSINDIYSFKKKFDPLKEINSSNKWAGIYGSGATDTVSFSQLRWEPNSGFISFYIYTCLPELRYINYGKVAETSEYIELIPEFVQSSPRKSTPVRYVKIKWDDRRYLVEESVVPAFAEKAVGIYADDEDEPSEKWHKWTNHWVTGDFENELTGLPEFPKNYEKFLRSPVKANIVSVGKRQIKNEFSSGVTYYATKVAVYKVKINAGRKDGVKKRLTLLINDNEEVVITKVTNTSSDGVLVRHLNQDDSDECRNYEYDEIPCSKIEKGQQITSKVGQMYYY